MQNLLSLLEEEASILDLGEPGAERLQENMMSAYRKIATDGPVAVLTPQEVYAVKEALTDAGELYLFGQFDVESERERAQHMAHGRRAREQAAALGIYVRES